MEGLGLLLGEEFGFLFIADCEGWSAAGVVYVVVIVPGKLSMTFVVNLIIDICAAPGWKKLRSIPR
jgi:hypothetical protein